VFYSLQNIPTTFSPTLQSQAFTVHKKLSRSSSRMWFVKTQQHTEYRQFRTGHKKGQLDWHHQDLVQRGRARNSMKIICPTASNTNLYSKGNCWNRLKQINHLWRIKEWRKWHMWISQNFQLSLCTCKTRQKQITCSNKIHAGRHTKFGQ